MIIGEPCKLCCCGGMKPCFRGTPSSPTLNPADKTAPSPHCSFCSLALAPSAPRSQAMFGLLLCPLSEIRMPQRVAIFRTKAATALQPSPWLLTWGSHGPPLRMCCCYSEIVPWGQSWDSDPPSPGCAATALCPQPEPSLHLSSQGGAARAIIAPVIPGRCCCRISLCPTPPESLQ